jgi:hypothetical protein
MARPIKPTPVLKGKDAVNFFKNIANHRKVSKEDIDSLKKNAAALRECFKPNSDKNAQECDATKDDM